MFLKEERVDLTALHEKMFQEIRRKMTSQEWMKKQVKNSYQTPNFILKRSEIMGKIGLDIENPLNHNFTLGISNTFCFYFFLVGFVWFFWGWGGVVFFPPEI